MASGDERGSQTEVLGAQKDHRLDAGHLRASLEDHHLHHEAMIARGMSLWAARTVAVRASSRAAAAIRVEDDDDEESDGDDVVRAAGRVLGVRPQEGNPCRADRRERAAPAWADHRNCLPKRRSPGR